MRTARAQDSSRAVAAVSGDVTVEPAASAAVGEENGSSPLAYEGGAIEDPGSPVDPTAVSAGVAPGSNAAVQSANQAGGNPDFNSEFIMPVKGHDLGVLRNYDAVDITSACGTPVVASADGLVIPDQSHPEGMGGRNGGYGNFVLLEHSFGDGIFTRYAHLSKVLANIGSYVKQGQEIGLVGKTGDATGCQLRFEVIGAQNPFEKK